MSITLFTPLIRLSFSINKSSLGFECSLKLNFFGRNKKIKVFRQKDRDSIRGYQLNHYGLAVVRAVRL
jgi:hypothetical protein